MSSGEPTESDSAGARLASARERLGLSLDQVADKLKLDRYTIVALEEGDHRAIGAAVFVRGFLRRYAALVGESPAEIEALYARRPDAEARPDLSKTGMHRIEPAAFRQRLGVLPALTAALALGIAGAAWWAMWVRSPLQTAGSGAGAQVVQTDAADGGAGANVGAEVATPATGTAAAAVSGAQPPGLLGRRRLQLTFNGECWVEVYDLRGVRLFFGFGHAGTAQELSGVAPFRLVLGNVEAMAVAVDGVPVSLPAGVPGTRVRILLDANGAVAAVP